MQLPITESSKKKWLCKPILDDLDAWSSVDPGDLWVYDKLILSRQLGHVCGPVGIPVPRPGEYIIRPITNLLGMGKGAYNAHLAWDTSHLPSGHFWCERFVGQHHTYDFVNGHVAVGYEGFPSSPTRFSRWVRMVNPTFTLPESIRELSQKYGHINIETIGGKIIEVHLRGNPDWIKHRADVLIPVWKEDVNRTPPSGFEYVDDPAEDRVGFFIKCVPL